MFVSLRGQGGVRGGGDSPGVDCWGEEGVRHQMAAQREAGIGRAPSVDGFQVPRSCGCLARQGWGTVRSLTPPRGTRRGVRYLWRVEGGAAGVVASISGDCTAFCGGGCAGGCGQAVGG